MDRCHNCDQELIEIDNRGQRLVGCLTCNLWAADGTEGWTRLSEEDLNALHWLRPRVAAWPLDFVGTPETLSQEIGWILTLPCKTYSTKATGFKFGRSGGRGRMV